MNVYFLQKILMKLGFGVAVRAVRATAGSWALVMAASTTTASATVPW